MPSAPDDTSQSYDPADWPDEDSRPAARTFRFSSTPPRRLTSAERRRVAAWIVGLVVVMAVVVPALLAGSLALILSVFGD